MSRPPRFATWLLRILLHPDDREHALGDLAEEYEGLRHLEGDREARRWYRAQARGAVAPSLMRLLRRVAPAELAREARLSVRSLTRRPGLLGVSVATLGLGIGAATAIFSVADGVLLRPLPYPDGDRLVSVWNTYDSWRGQEVLDAYWDRIALSWPEYVDWRDAQRSFDRVGIYGTTLMALTGRGDPVQVATGFASSTLLPMLGATPALGRLFATGEEGAAAPAVAVVSHRLWRERLGADPRIVGSTLTLDGEPFEIVGVLAAGFRLRPTGFAVSAEFRHDVWLPVGAAGVSLDRGSHSFEALGLLTEAVGLEAARDEVVSLVAAAADGTRGARLTMRKAEEIGSAQDPILLLLAAVGLLLLIACGNVASLLLGDVTSRRPELATKAALGAGTGRLVRQLAMESLVIGLLGAALGVALARLGSSALMRLAPSDLPLPDGAPMDARVIAFAVAAGCLTGLAAGTLPALSLRPSGLRDAMRGGGRSGTSGRGVQRTVVGAQVAVSLLLLASGALLGRSLWRLQSVGPGFEGEGVMTARVALPEARYGSEGATAFFRGLVEDLSARPGQRATLTSAMPFSGRGGSSSFRIVGREIPESEKSPEAHRRTVLPSFHALLGIPLVEGRYLSDADRVEQAPVIVVSASMAARHWPDGTAIGSRITRDRRDFEIVGIVGDVLHFELSEQPLPTFYVPFDVAEERHGMTVVVRHDGEASEAADAIRGAVASLDPDLPVEDVESVASLLAASTRPERFRSLLLIAFAVVATALSAVGLFGVTARMVAARGAELGVRVALGARRPAIVRHLLMGELPALLLGLAAGLVAALVSARVLSGFLFSVSAADPATLAATCAGLATIGVLAILGAAARALSLDPVRAIRAE